MSDLSRDKELERMCQEIICLSLKAQQLKDRRDVLSVLIDFRSRTNVTNKAEDAKEQSEIRQIDQELQKIFEKKKELQDAHDKMSNHGIKTHDYITSLEGVPVLPVDFVESPPSTPAPEVILDIERLPPCPSQTQCPHCREFITTEISTSIGEAACLACVTLSVFGCVAGCCLLPFCIANCKDIKHKCPKCRSSIVTIKKL
ncbi:hypothetical protein UPYG_G00100230 [Umbra pygmaea]|uniref:LITAF domain-containing protein n=1 Tax=Umbra pygmaea TaxID=75934 RepID=A0ABD0X0J8_UMBPY